jgi:Protein of unknown function (DUF998)
MRTPTSSGPGAIARIAGREPVTRLGAIAGIAGPAAFTCAWIVASLRQTGHPAAAVQLSGLAAPDARDPGIMIAGFVVLGSCTVAFGGSLHRALGGPAHPGPRSGRPGAASRPPGPGAARPGLASRRPGPGPRLIQWAGALTIAAGLFRRDHMMLVPPGAAGGESWHNQAHDVVSAIIYVTLVVAPLLLAVRFRGDPGWQRLCAPLTAGSAVTAGLLGVFASANSAPWDAILQRIAVTIPLVVLTAVAARLMIAGPAEAGPRMPAAPAQASRVTTSQ